MTEYVRVWATEDVAVKVSINEETLVMERTRGRKQRKKQVALELDNFRDLVPEILEAAKQKPNEQLTNRIPMAMVDGGRGLITIEWGPYWFGSCNALMIRGPHAGQCIAVEENAAVTFGVWLFALVLELLTTGRLPLESE